MDRIEVLARMVEQQKSLRDVVAATGEYAEIAKAADEQALAMSLYMVQEAIREYAIQLNRLAVKVANADD